MYLVIKNGTQKKSYQCTNTCNKPRVCISNSYIPLTNNIQSKPKCIINSMEVASYKSYTYTTDQGTITTGTTYLTRASTSNTVYGTDRLIINSDVKRVYTTRSGYISTTFSWGKPYAPRLSDEPFDEAVSKYPIDYASTGPYAISYISKVNGIYVFANGRSGAATGTLYTSDDDSRIVFYLSGTIKRNVHVTASYTSNTYIFTTTRQSIFSTLRESYTSVVITTGTSYQTRASTSGTSYGTKTTNKTLTSSSWG